MHIMLCMSPAGDTLRLRCRNFPGLVSNTSIDWFFPWPEEALADVANYFLKTVDIESEIRQSITDHIVMIHTSVQTYSEEFEATYKRRNYSTPKNYLDFITNYMKFLANKRKMLDAAVIRLEGGLTTLEKAAEDTKTLSEELAIKNADIAEKKIIVEELIADIT
jgi:dynein heavy chain